MGLSKSSVNAFFNSFKLVCVSKNSLMESFHNWKDGVFKKRHLKPVKDYF